MSDTDTSAEAVERLAGYLTGHHIYGGSVVITDAAATLRALLAERDSYKKAVENAVAAIQHNHDEWLKMQAERDAARAEAARLGQAVAKIADDARYYCDHEPVAGWLPRMKDIRDTAREALAAKEPGHE